jgi:hypothetical protein
MLFFNRFFFWHDAPWKIGVGGGGGQVADGCGIRGLLEGPKWGEGAKKMEEFS